MNPLFNNILITPESPATKIGGIVVPGKNDRETSMGTVLAVGEEVTKVSKDMKVYYAKVDAKKVEVGGEELLVVKEKDLLGISS